MFFQNRTILVALGLSSQLHHYHANEKMLRLWKNRKQLASYRYAKTTNIHMFKKHHDRQPVTSIPFLNQNVNFVKKNLIPVVSFIQVIVTRKK